MEEKKTIFDYLGEVLIIYGIVTLILNGFCILFGEDAQKMSSIFALGNKGLSVSVSLEFFALSILTVFSQFLFFTEGIIRRMGLALRTVCMLLSEVAYVVVFTIAFEWFPFTMWQPWVMFLICLGICFLLSLGVLTLKERTENRKMEEALKKLQQKEGEKQ